MKKIIILLGLLFLTLNVKTLYSETEKPVTVHIHREGGGGSIWNLWGEYYSEVDFTYEGSTERDKYTLICRGNGRLECRMPSFSVPKINPMCVSFGSDLTDLTDPLEDYAGLQIQNNVLIGNYSDIINCQGQSFLRTVIWDGIDINNNNIIVNIIKYTVPY